MFVAPCTLPLVPAYIAFISGVDPADIKNSKTTSSLRSRVFMNGLMYVLGFSVVFVLFGVSAGFVGMRILGEYRVLFTRVTGIFVIIFGLFMLNIVSFRPLRKDRKAKLPAIFQKGRLSTSFLLGAAFAFGWTPCIGPLLASVLLLASTSATALQGGILLAVFSLGMGIPFLIVAWSVGSAYKNLEHLKKYMPVISRLGGVFLVILGALLFFDRLGLLIAYGYEWFGGFGYENLLKYY